MLIILCIVLMYVYLPPTQALVKNSTTGKDSFAKAQELLLAQDFSGAQIVLKSAIADFESSQQLFEKYPTRAGSTRGLRIDTAALRQEKGGGPL